MYMNACLIYEDVEARLLQERDGIHLILYTKQMDIAVSFSYAQLKVLTDGCAALLANLKINDCLDSEHHDLKGALQLKAELPAKATKEEAKPARNLPQSA